MYQSLQACRAAAAALVVLFHLGGSFAQDKYFGFKAIDVPFSWADAGVEFFFVLSAFLITLTHRDDFGRPQALGPYLVKRLLRIYPTYWLVCLGVCAAALFVPSLREALPGDVSTLLKALALIPQDPAVVGGTGAPILFVAWSLHYEMLFYGVVAIAIAHRSAGLLAGAALLIVHLGCRDGGCAFPSSFLASNLIFLFVLGMASAYAVRSRLPLPRPGLIATLAAVALLATGLYEIMHGRDTLPIDRRLVYGVIAAILVTALARYEDVRPLRPRRWVAVLGESSYALYLLHIPVISVMCKLFAHFGLSGRVTLTLAFGFAFAICMLSAVIFHLAIERPMLARFRTLTRKRPARAPVAPWHAGPSRW